MNNCNDESRILTSTICRPYFMYSVYYNNVYIYMWEHILINEFYYFRIYSRIDDWWKARWRNEFGKNNVLLKKKSLIFFLNNLTLNFKIKNNHNIKVLKYESHYYKRKLNKYIMMLWNKLISYNWFMIN